MNVIAGVDIGNATTEIVLTDAAKSPPVPIAWDRAPTQGIKGSAQAAQAAARLLRRMERRFISAHPGSAVKAVHATRQVPVRTMAQGIQTPPVDTGRLVVLARSVPTPDGLGLGIGIPLPLETEPITDRPVVLVATDPLGYRNTVRLAHRWFSAGADVQALLLAGDEARIVGLGLTTERPAAMRDQCPIVDRVDTGRALACSRVAVEVRASTLRHLSDALWLRSAFDLDAANAFALPVVAQQFRGASSGAVGILEGPVVSTPSTVTTDVLHLRNGEQIPLLGGARILSTQPVGTVRGITLNGTYLSSDDAWLVETGTLIGHRQYARRDSYDDVINSDEHGPSERGPSARGPSRRVPSDHIALSILESATTDSDNEDPFAAFRQFWPVHVVGTEAQAAYLGAGTTPGAHGHTLVIDLGGGTLDVITEGALAGECAAPHSVTAAGCGQLLTTATASVLGISNAMAEWVKRGPAQRAEAPNLVSTEDGQRQFSAAPQSTHNLGWLTATGPAGPLPFAAHLTLGEWRQLRLALKEAVIGHNLARILTSPPNVETSVVLVGGPAGDDEVFESLVHQLPWGLLGRGNVAGILGHRWAVAYGLTLIEPM